MSDNTSSRAFSTTDIINVLNSSPSMLNALFTLKFTMESILILLSLNNINIENYPMGFSEATKKLHEATAKQLSQDEIRKRRLENV